MTATCAATWKGGKCEDPARKKGFCFAHYQRDRRGGPSGPVQRLAPTVRFEVQLERDQRQRLEQRARELGMRPGAAVRRAVALWLAELELEEARREKDAAVLAVIRTPPEVSEEEKRANLGRSGVAAERALEAERALDALRGRP